MIWKMIRIFTLSPFQVNFWCSSACKSSKFFFISVFSPVVHIIFILPFFRPAMIRSELCSALRRYPTEEEAAGGASVQPVGQLQSLIAQRMQRAQELLEEMRLQV